MAAGGPATGVPNKSAQAIPCKQAHFCFPRRLSVLLWSPHADAGDGRLYDTSTLHKPSDREAIPYPPTRPRVLVRPSARRIPYSPTNAHPYQLSIKTTAETWPAERLSWKWAIFSPGTRQCNYRTLPQETSRRTSGLNTVLSDKSIPYPPARDYRTLRQISASYRPVCDPDEQVGQDLPANPAFLPKVALHSTIPYSPASFTVLPHKQYRTLQQGIPYSPTSFTVPSDN
jgi:hypothetical protein